MLSLTLSADHRVIDGIVAARFLADLVATFPAEERALRRYLSDVKRTASWIAALVARNVTPAPIGWLLTAAMTRRRSLAVATTGSYLDAHFRDPRLKSILGARWGDYGL